MALDQLLTDSEDYSDIAIEYVPSVTRGLAYWGWLGDSATRTKKNQWTGSGAIADAAITGTPTYGAGYATFKSLTNYLTLPMSDDTDDFTILCVAATDDDLAASATQPAYMGNFINPNGGVILQTAAGTAPNLGSVGIFEAFDNASTPAATGPVSSMGSSSTVIQTADPKVYTVFAGVFVNGTGLTIYDLGRNLAATKAQAVRRLRNPLNNIQVGGGVFAARQGTSRMAHAAVFRAALTKAELDQLVANDIKPYLTYRGLTLATA
ncbi:MAG: hypothetical protein E7K72_02260 [Roseomonas mucosa]|nr:hypothetical protein [Roseomonas mucosa]